MKFDFFLSLPVAILIGFLAGLVRACQGAYKDTPWEPFVPLKFERSLLLGTLGGIVWYFILQFMNLDVHPAIFMAMCVFFDSITTEVYKRGIRVESLRKYKMPTIIHIHGHIIKNRFLRILLGFSIYIGAFGLFFLINNLSTSVVSIQNQTILGIVWGLIAGTIVATGGAALDEAWEGFYPLKFLRSVWVGGYWGLIFSFFTSSAALIVFGCLGMDRMSIEFFKTFIRKAKSGKFKHENPVYPAWMKIREKFLDPYLLPWLTFVFFIVAF